MHPRITPEITSDSQSCSLSNLPTWKDMISDTETRLLSLSVRPQHQARHIGIPIPATQPLPSHPPQDKKKTHREEKIIKRINTPNADTTPRQPGGRTDPTLGGTPQPLNIQHAHPLSPEILIEVTPYPTASVAMYPLHGNAVSYAFT